MKPNPHRPSDRMRPRRTTGDRIEHHAPSMVLRKTGHRLTIVLMMTFLMMGLRTSPSQGQETMLTINNSDAYAAKQRTFVAFPHDLHMGEFECLDCHHEYADGENILDEDELEADNPAIRCAACHDSNAPIDLKSAHHRQCVGCHREMRKGKLAIGPELCGECHVKRSA